MKIVITGGHITPALAYIEYCKKNHPSDEIHFFGRRYSQSFQQQEAVELKSVSKLGIPFYAIDIPKLHSYKPWHWVLFMFQYIVQLYKVFFNLIKIKPQCILSFGGYLAIPVAYTGWLLRIPVVTHEQTITAGRANKYIAHIAHTVAVSFENSISAFGNAKTSLIGNPIRSSILTKQKMAPSWFNEELKKPILYITGGNQGSYIINTVMQQILKQITKDFVVIHTCGRATTSINYLEELTQYAKTLPAVNKNRYFVREWIDSEELGWVLQNASLCISRAGANSIHELIISKVPSILVPLPFSHNNEQQLNAKFMSDSGGAITIAQKDFSPTVALQTIKSIMATQKAMSRKLESLEVPTDAAQKLHSLVTSTCKHTTH